ncbi:hypothetical protein RQP46_003273 [Phenoliferia psychrophenolica]
MAKASAPRRSSTRLATRAGAASADSDAPPPRAFHLPPEILELVLAQAFISDCSPDEAYHEEFSWRNSQLAALALVSRAWTGPVYAELYGDLRVAWLAGNVDKLLESFTNNPSLLLRVRRFEAFGVLASRLLEERVDESEMAIEEEGAHALMSADKSSDEAEAEWRSSVVGQRYQGATAPGSLEVLAAQKKRMKVAGHFAWTSRTVDLWGFEELLDLVEGATNLRFLAVHGFAFDLPDHLLHRGPFGFTSLDTGNHSPFDIDIPRFVSFLAARAPDLRYLATAAPNEDDPEDEVESSTPLPALISLRLDTEYRESFPPTVIAALELLQPSLRALTFSNRGGVKWGAVLAPFLSTLEALDLSAVEYQTSKHIPSQIAAITPAIALSTSLRHLGLALTFIPPYQQDFQHQPPPWLPEQLFTALPSSLVSLTLAPFAPQTLGMPVTEYFARVLAALKKSNTRPGLRVKTRVESKDRDGLLEIVEEFGNEGIVLVV